MRRLMIGMFAALALSGCESDACATMRACCATVAGEEWVGSSCGSLATGASDSRTCETITDTIVHGLKTRDQAIPAACSEDPR